MTVRSNTVIMLVSSSLMIGSKGHPKTSCLTYNNTPRHNQKELNHQIYINFRKGRGTNSHTGYKNVAKTNNF